MREMGVGLRGLTKYRRRVRALEEKCLRRQKIMGRYKEEANQARRKMKNTMHLQTIQSEGLTVHSKHNLSTTGPCIAISIKGSVKEGSGQREQMRSEGSDRETWSAFWLAVLGNSLDFLFIFFVCDLDSCTLIVTNFIWTYLHEYWVLFDNLSCIGKPSRRPFQ